MENMDLEWLPSNGIPTSVSISVFIENSGILYAGGTQMNDVHNSQAVIYISKDSGATWEEFVKITDELSSISAMYINENTLIVAGRKGQVQQDWQGGIYKVSL